jgi:hypothetical protein
MFFWRRALALSALTTRVTAQYYLGYDGDKPMLENSPPRTGTSAMLRFGCSQVVIERLDPYVDSSMGRGRNSKRQG